MGKLAAAFRLAWRRWFSKVNAKLYPTMTTQKSFLTSWRAILVVAIVATRSITLTAAEDPVSAARNALEAVSPPAQVSTNAEVELRKTQEAIEKLRRELEARSTQNSEAITSSMRLIETSMSRMHERHMEAVQSSNHAILTVAGVFAAVGIIGIIFVLILLARALGRFSEIIVSTSPRGLLGAGQAGLIGGGDASGTRPGSAEEAAGRFQGAIDQLQKRILELEQSAQATPAAGNRSRATVATVAKAADGSNIQPLMPEDAPEAAKDGEPPASRATVLLGKGQALLNLDATEPAMQCFNEAIDLEPNNAEALVKRGMAFEKMQDWERALENYDRAIAADNSMTVAYLYRGGVCNRLQRYREALESYEQALRTEKSSRAS